MFLRAPSKHVKEAAVQFSWDFNTATLSLIVLQIIAFVVFIIRTHGRANGAYELAEKAHKRADEAHIAVGAYNAAHMLFREHVAAEYVDREALREMENRLTSAIDRLGDRLDQSMHRPR